MVIGITAPASPQSGIPLGPDYALSSLNCVLPSMVAALCTGHSLKESATWEPLNTLNMPQATRACLLMVDGLGAHQLERYRGHAPFLSKILNQDSQGLTSSFPTTTAASLSSLGTGLAPGGHGLVGYDVYDPDRDVVINQLGGWDPKTDPTRWQPHPSVFEQLPRELQAVTVSLPAFEDSALTRAALSGSDFISGKTLQARFRAARGQLEKSGRLVYLYVNELDKAGHKHGPGSDAWLYELEEIDAAARRLSQSLPPNALLAATGDHGMITVEPDDRIDYSQQPELLEGVAHTAGEPRFVQLHFGHDVPQSTRDKTTQQWKSEYGEQAWILTREEAIAYGWFGSVDDRVYDRIGDLNVAAHAPIALYDSRRAQPRAFEMVGHHGSPTPEERQVPLLFLKRPKAQ